MALVDVVSAVVTQVRAISGVKQAPDYPPEKAAEFPFAVVYPVQFTGEVETPLNIQMYYTIRTELHLARKDLPEDVRRLLPFAESGPKAIFNGLIDAGCHHEGIEGNYRSMRYGGVDTIGYEWDAVRVKVDTPFSLDADQSLDPTLANALSIVIDAAGGVSGVNYAPDYPPEQIPDWPAVVVYPSTYRGQINTPEDFRMLHDIRAEMHLARRDLPEDFRRMLPFAESLTGALFGALHGNQIAHSGVIGRMEALSWGAVDTRAYTWTIRGVKVITSLS